MDQLDEICTANAAYRLPRWEDLPDLELYMDQVLSLAERYLGGCPGLDGRALTASMVNNYVKLGVIPAPVKKRYSRVHLARLLMLCLLKGVLPIASIRALFEAGLAGTSEQDYYNAFCRACAQAGQEAAAAARADAEGAPALILRAALRAQAEQALAQALLGLQDGRA